MKEHETNQLGLYDSSVRSNRRLPLPITADDIESQLQSGAFVMTRSEAVELGYLNPYDEQDTADLHVVREET